MTSRLLVIVIEEKDRERILRALNLALRSRRMSVLDDVKVLLWGESEGLVANDDPEIQAILSSLINEGVEVLACLGVAKQLGIKEKLENMGIKVESATKIINEHVKLGYETAWF